MTTVINRRIEVENPSAELVMFCKKNLVLRNPEYDNKKRMGFWIGNTPEYLYLYETNGNKLILPYGLLKKIAPMLGNDVHMEFAPKVQLDFRCDVSLYPYQECAVTQMSTAPVGILKSRAGSGKTRMGLAMIGRRGVKTLWLAHTIDLINQAYNSALEFYDKEDLAKMVGGKVQIGRVITFATIQTMSSQELTSLRNEWDMVIVDECHRACLSAKGYTMFSKVLNNLCARYKYGLSATPKRADGLIRATFSMLGEVLYEVPDEDVVDRVMKVGVKVVDTDYDFSDECLNPDGTLNNNLILDEMVHDVARNNCIVDHIEEGKSSIILSDRLEHLELLMDALPYEDKAMISGKMTSKKDKEARAETLDKMRSGELKYLFATYSLCKEGLDIPRLERLYMATPQKDSTVITQSLGRIARRFEGKEDAIAYDFVDKSGYLVRKYKQRVRTYKKEGCYYVE